MWQGRPDDRPCEKEGSTYIGKIPQTIININCQQSDWDILEAGSRVMAQDDNKN
jgi:hypothetical protein